MKGEAEGAASDAQELSQALDRFGHRIDALLSKQGTSNSSTITLTGGSLGVWVCATACLIMLASAVPTLFWVGSSLRENRSEVRELREQHAADVKDLRSTDNVIRAYINAGAVQQAGEKK